MREFPYQTVILALARLRAVYAKIKVLAVKRDYCLTTCAVMLILRVLMDELGHDRSPNSYTEPQTRSYGFAPWRELPALPTGGGHRTEAFRIV
jgi:hypothetical protein